MANLTPFDPFSEIRSLQKQLFGDDPYASLPSSTKLWPTDIYTQDNSQIVIEAHLPDFSAKDVSVTTDNGILEIQADKHETKTQNNRNYIVRESSHSYYRRVRLPEQANISAITASMDDSILRVSVPFKDIPSPTKITIVSNRKN